jgi:DNA helicase-2/ATP-dependent DNA helicase PcrA
MKLRPNGVGDGALMAVYRLTDERGDRYAETLQAIADDQGILAHNNRRRLAEGVQEINDLLEEHADLLKCPVEEGVEALLELAVFEDDEDRDEVANLLLGLPVEGEEEPTLGSIELALHSSRGRMDEAERAGDRDRIQIMTMHSAKGLTADAVIVAACEEELVPGPTEDRRELDDQRRLLYVSLTRARHFLFVTFARQRPGQQSHLLQAPVARTYTSFLRDFLPPSRAT